MEMAADGFFSSDLIIISPPPTTSLVDITPFALLPRSSLTITIVAGFQSPTPIDITQ